MITRLKEYFHRLVLQPIATQAAGDRCYTAQCLKIHCNRCRKSNSIVLSTTVSATGLKTYNGAMICAPCLAMALQGKLHENLHSVTDPLSTTTRLLQFLAWHCASSTSRLSSFWAGFIYMISKSQPGTSNRRLEVYTTSTPPSPSTNLPRALPKHLCPMSMERIDSEHNLQVFYSFSFVLLINLFEWKQTTETQFTRQINCTSYRLVQVNQSNTNS